MPRLRPPEKSEILRLEPFAGLTLSQIVLPRSGGELDAAWADLATQRCVGFDTESRPTFVKGEQSSGPDVVQFATAQRAYVFQLRHAAVQDCARAVLTAPGVLKVGFDLRQDQSQLLSRLGVHAAPVLDLTRVFRDQGYPPTIGISSAVAIVFGQRFVKSKRVTTTNWSLERLEPRQLLYAANDAYAALRVMQALNLPPDAPPA